MACLAFFCYLVVDSTDNIYFYQRVLKQKPLSCLQVDRPLKIPRGGDSQKPNFLKENVNPESGGCFGVIDLFWNNNALG